MNSPRGRHAMKLDVLQRQCLCADALRGRILERNDMRVQRFLLMRAIALPEAEPHRHRDDDEDQDRRPSGFS